MIALIRNETLKLIRRKRFYIVVGILAAIIGVVSYGQYRHLKNQPHRNWRADLQQRVASYNNSLRRSASDACGRSCTARQRRPSPNRAASRSSDQRSSSQRPACASKAGS